MEKQARDQKSILIQDRINVFFYFKNGIFLVHFRSFQANITIFTSNNVKNVHPVYGAGIRTHELQIASLVP